MFQSGVRTSMSPTVFFQLYILSIVSPSTQQPPGNRTNDGCRALSDSARSTRSPCPFHVFLRQERNHVQEQHAFARSRELQSGFGIAARGGKVERVILPIGRQAGDAAAGQLLPAGTQESHRDRSGEALHSSSSHPECVGLTRIRCSCPSNLRSPAKTPLPPAPAGSGD